MRVAALQIPADPTGMSHALMMLTQGITRAAAQIPAPDLIVLPDLSAGNLPARSPQRYTRGMVQGHVEALAWQAREWGVWMALGYRSSAEPHHQKMALLDPDGDKYAVHRSNLGSQNGDQESPSPFSRRVTPLGVIALWSDSPTNSFADIPADSLAGIDLVIVSASEAAEAVSVNEMSDLAQRLNAFVVVAAPAGKDPGGAQHTPRSSIFDPSGAVLAEARLGRTDEIIADLDIELNAQAAAELAGNWEAVEDLE